MIRDKEEVVVLDLDVKSETEKAYLVSDGEVQSWLPKSQIVHVDLKYAAGVPSKFTIPEWLAQRAELI